MVSNPKFAKEAKAWKQTRYRNSHIPVVEVEIGSIKDIQQLRARKKSEGWVYVQTEYVHELNQLVDVQLRVLDKEEPFHAQGRVVWIGDNTKPATIGVRLVNFEASIKGEIKKILLSHSFLGVPIPGA